MVVEQPAGAPLRLPAGWVARKSEESGTWYYVNKRSGEASWKVPTAGSWRDRMGFEDAAAANGGGGGGRAMLTAYQLDYPRKELNSTRAQEKFRLAKEMRNMMRGRWAGYSDRNVHRTFETTSKGLFPPPPPPATAPEGGASSGVAGGGRGAKQQQQPQPHIAPHTFEGVTTNQAYYKWVWPEGGAKEGGSAAGGSGAGGGATPAKSGRRGSRSGSVSASEAPSAPPPTQRRSSRRTAATAAAAAAASSSSGGGGGEGGKFVSETTNMAHYTGHPGVGRSGSCRPKERPLMETSPFVATTQYTADFDERAFATGTFRRNALRLHKDHAHLTKVCSVVGRVAIICYFVMVVLFLLSFSFLFLPLLLSSLSCPHLRLCCGSSTRAATGRRRTTACTATAPVRLRSSSRCPRRATRGVGCGRASACAAERRTTSSCRRRPGVAGPWQVGVALRCGGFTHSSVINVYENIHIYALVNSSPFYFFSEINSFVFPLCPAVTCGVRKQQRRKEQRKRML